MVHFHDRTQAVRIQEFSENILQGHIPPRISTQFSYGMGYPVFTYYAPTAYWASSIFYIVGFDAVSALKISFIFATTIAFISMFLYLSRRFSNNANILGSVLYALSPYVATEIFVRGNISEIWLFALFPLTLYLLEKTHESKKSYAWLFLFSIVFSLLITSHNALSLVAAPFIVIYAFILGINKKTIVGLLAGFLLSLYFTLPALLTLQTTHSLGVAKNINYLDHFLCTLQVWDSPLGFEGSVRGCEDGMSFMLGKIVVIMGIVGMALFLHSLKNKKNSKKQQQPLALIAIFSIVSFFMTISLSQPVWSTFMKLLSLFQFPWRFLLFVLFGLSVFSAYAISYFEKEKRSVLFFVLGLITLHLLLYASFFSGKQISISDYHDMYLSDAFMKNEVVYGIPEYIPKNVDIEAYYSYQKSPELLNSDSFIIGVIHEVKINEHFYKVAIVNDKNFIINLHYQPYWEIEINNAKYVPSELDKLGRPIINVDEIPAKVVIKYRQTTLQMFSNVISCVTLGLLASLLIYSVWQRKKKHH